MATSDETIQDKIWRLQDKLNIMASMCSAYVGQPMDIFIISESQCKEWESDDQGLIAKSEVLRAKNAITTRFDQFEERLEPLPESWLRNLGLQNLMGGEQSSDGHWMQLMDAPAQFMDGCNFDATVQHLDGRSSSCL